MSVAFLGPETVRVVVEYILAKDNVRVFSLDQATLLPKAILLIVIARPLRTSLLSRLRNRFPRARLVAIAKNVRRAPVEMLGFADVRQLRQHARDVLHASAARG
jgi:hypothetical protein